MSDPTDVVERYLRDTFAADADVAPAPYDLTGEAVRRGRAHRRRSAITGAALSVVLVAGAVFVGQNVWSTATPQPVPGASGNPVPSASDLSGESVLMFRGVEVPVPASMLAPGNRRCGIPFADSAYVGGLMVNTCDPGPPPPGLTVVVMSPLEDISQDELSAGGHILADGRYMVASAIPGRDVWLTVTSPSKDRADQLFGGAVIASSPKGCEVQPAAPPEAVGHGVILPPLSGGAIGRVCGYRDGWLTGAALISGADLRELYAQVTTAPSDVSLDCKEQPSAGYGWWLTLGESTVWVQGASCSGVIVDGGGAGRLTSALSSRLWELAPGPIGFDDLVGDNG